MLLLRYVTFIVVGDAMRMFMPSFPHLLGLSQPRAYPVCFYERAIPRFWTFEVSKLLISSIYDYFKYLIFTVE